MDDQIYKIKMHEKKALKETDKLLKMDKVQDKHVEELEDECMNMRHKKYEKAMKDFGRKGK